MIPKENVVQTTEKKLKIFGLVMIFLISGFSFSVVSIFNNKNEKKLDEVNRKAELREATANAKRNAYLEQNIYLTQKVTSIEGQVIDTRKRIIKLEPMYNQSLIELKKMNNEKNYVPTYVPATEQQEFLSNYRYQPY